MLASTKNDNEIVSVRGRALYIRLFFKKADVQGAPPDGYNFIIIVRWQHCLIRFKLWLNGTL